MPNIRDKYKRCMTWLVYKHTRTQILCSSEEIICFGWQIHKWLFREKYMLCMRHTHSWENSKINILSWFLTWHQEVVGWVRPESKKSGPWQLLSWKNVCASARMMSPFQFFQVQGIYPIMFTCKLHQFLSEVNHHFFLLSVTKHFNNFIYFLY